MTSSPVSSRPRPLSPHLQIYRWQWTMALSILHRITGCTLAVGVPVLVFWLATAAYAPACYAWFIEHVKHPIGHWLLVGWTLAFFYHLFAGIRHLVWDTGHGYALSTARASGYFVVFCALTATAFIWLS